MEYCIDTEKLQTIQTTLSQERQKIMSKSSVFYAGAFGTSGDLSSALLKIKNIYGNIPQTLENIRMYLKEYTNDVEMFENAMSGGGGYVKVGDVSSIIRTNQSLCKDKLFQYEMNSATLFQIRTYQPSKTTQAISSTTMDSSSNGASDGTVEGNKNQDVMDSVSYPDFSLSLPHFDFSTFDFNLNVIDFSLGDFMSSMDVNFSSLSAISMAYTGMMSSWGSNGNLSMNFGMIDISKLGNLNFSDLDIASNLILKDLLNVNGIDISGITNLGQLSIENLNGKDISKLTLTNGTLQMLQNQIHLGNISEIDALHALQQLFPSLSHMSFSEIMNLYSVNGIYNLESGALGANSLSTGAISGVGVSSGLLFGFGAFGLFGKSKGNTGFGKSSFASSAISSEKGKSFSFLGDAIRNDVTDADVVMDSSFINDFKEDSSFLVSKDVEMLNPLQKHLLFDYETILQDVIFKLKKFNEVKKSFHYLELIHDANSMREIKNETDMEERISFLIPSIFPLLMKNFYLYHEICHQDVFERNFHTYQHLYSFIINPSDKRFKWLVLTKERNVGPINFRSFLNVNDNVFACGNITVSQKFRTPFAFIEDGICDIIATYQQVYDIEVPKYFHSHMVIDDHSTDYDRLLEKLDSLSVQAMLNQLSIEDSKNFLVQEIHSLKLNEKNLYCFQNMLRIREQGVQEVILVIRIGDGIYPYRYFACYPGVGLREIYSLDVNMLMEAGFLLEEE